MSHAATAPRALFAPLIAAAAAGEVRAGKVVGPDIVDVMKDGVEFRDGPG